MKFGHAALVLSLVVSAGLTGCALTGRTLAPAAQPRWLLVAAPPTRDFPTGYNGTPISKWSQIGEYASMDVCEDSTREAANKLQVPVQCVATDDPRLKGATPTRLASSIDG
jgi:hypothetical protein